MSVSRQRACRYYAYSELRCTFQVTLPRIDASVRLYMERRLTCFNTISEMTP
jgi:hypothetical protein